MDPILHVRDNTVSSNLAPYQRNHQITALWPGHVDTLHTWPLFFGEQMLLFFLKGTGSSVTKSKSRGAIERRSERNGERAQQQHANFLSSVATAESLGRHSCGIDSLVWPELQQLVVERHFQCTHSTNSASCTACSLASITAYRPVQSPHTGSSALN